MLTHIPESTDSILTSTSHDVIFIISPTLFIALNRKMSFLLNSKQWVRSKDGLELPMCFCKTVLHEDKTLKCSSLYVHHTKPVALWMLTNFFTHTHTQNEMTKVNGQNEGKTHHQQCLCSDANVAGWQEWSPSASSFLLSLDQLGSWQNSFTEAKVHVCSKST